MALLGHNELNWAREWMEDTGLLATLVHNTSDARLHNLADGSPMCYCHKSITPKFVMPTALSCIDNSWRSTTLESAEETYLFNS